MIKITQIQFVLLLSIIHIDGLFLGSSTNCNCQQQICSPPSITNVAAAHAAKTHLNITQSLPSIFPSRLIRRQDPKIKTITANLNHTSKSLDRIDLLNRLQAAARFARAARTLIVTEVGLPTRFDADEEEMYKEQDEREILQLQRQHQQQQQQQQQQQHRQRQREVPTDQQQTVRNTNHNDDQVDEKCNNSQLRSIIIENIVVNNLSLSKMRISQRAEQIFGGAIEFDVICAEARFSYLVRAKSRYCEANRDGITCFAFDQ